MPILNSLMSCMTTMMLVGVVQAQTSKAKTQPLTDDRTLKRFLAERVVVDGHVTPKAWFGCCEAKPACSGKAGWARADCHQLSQTLSGTELLERVGANVSVVDYPDSAQFRRRVELLSPLLTSNQMDLNGEARHSFLYAQSLSLEVINDRQKLAAWSKRRHLAGIRLIRLIRHSSAVEEKSTSAISERGIQFLLDRHFLLDVGRLDRPTRLAVIAVAQERKKPVLLSGGFRSSSHACGNADSTQQTTTEELCAVAKGGGLLLIEPKQTLVADVQHTCTTSSAVDEYLIEQIKSFSAFTCNGPDGTVPIMPYLGLSSRLPSLPDPSHVFEAGQRPSRWHRFASRYINSGGRIRQLTQVLSDNWDRVLRMSLPGVQPARLLFPINDTSLSSDKAVQFQWEKPVVNNPKHMPGSVFGMRRHLIELERLEGGYFVPHLKKKVVMGNKKVLQISEGLFRWRVISSNRSGRSTADWGYFSIVEPSSL